MVRRREEEYSSRSGRRRRNRGFRLNRGNCGRNDCLSDRWKDGEKEGGREGESSNDEAD